MSVVRRDSSGRSELLDLNAVVGIPAGAIIQTFHIKQSWSLSLYMCIAYADKGNTTQSRLLVLKPFQASDITKDARLPAFTGEVDQLSRVEKIYMVCHVIQVTVLAPFLMSFELILRSHRLGNQRPHCSPTYILFTNHSTNLKTRHGVLTSETSEWILKLLSGRRMTLSQPL